MKMYQTKTELNQAIALHVNAVVPALLEALRDGFKQKVDHSLHKKDADRLREIYQSDDLHVWMDCSEYSFWLQVKGHYATGDHGCAYDQAYIHLQSSGDITQHFKPLPIWTEEDLNAAKDEIRQIESMIQELQGRKSGLKHTFNL